MPLVATMCYPHKYEEHAYAKRSMPTHPWPQDDSQMTKGWPRQFFIKLLTGNLRANLRATPQHEFHFQRSGRVSPNMSAQTWDIL